MATVWLIAKALLAVLPVIIGAVRDGRIRTGAQEEVVDAIRDRIDERVDAAERARAEPYDGSVRDDPHDRARRD